MTGEITIVHVDDFAHERSEFLYLLKDFHTNKTFKLRFAHTPPPHLHSGDVISVRGNAEGEEFVLAAEATGGASLTTLTPAATTAVVAGEQKTLVMVANFLDATVSCSISAISDLMFTSPTNQSIDDLYHETSFGNVFLTGRVLGPYTLNYSKTTCDFSAWADAADAAARAQGVDLTLYTRKVHVMPGNACPATGLGTVGGESQSGVGVQLYGAGCLWS